MVLPQHSVQSQCDVVSVVGMFVAQEQFGAGRHGSGLVAVHLSNRIRPLPPLPVEEVPESADPLGLPEADHLIDDVGIIACLGFGHVS